MAQEVEPQAPGSQPEEDDARTRSSAWPWIALAVLILIVVLVLWWYWRTPGDSGVTVIKTTEIPVALPASRPEPILPTASAAGSQDDSSPYVPDVLGDPQARAQRALQAAGYSVSTSYVFSASKASGLVEEQSPSGGTRLETGSQVSIVVSTGSPDTVEVTMPKVVGLTQAAAESKIKAAGLRPYVTYGTDPAHGFGDVISQWPAAGARLPEGSEGFIQVRLEDH